MSQNQHRAVSEPPAQALTLEQIESSMTLVDSFDAEFGVLKLMKPPRQVGGFCLTLSMRNTCANDYPESRVALDAGELRAIAVMLADAADLLEAGASVGVNPPAGSCGCEECRPDLHDGRNEPPTTAGIEVNDSEPEHVVIETSPVLSPLDEADLAGDEVRVGGAQ